MTKKGGCNRVPDMQFIDFDQFCSYAESLTNLEKQTSNYSLRVYRLDRMKALLNHIENPQNKFKSLHVAGSKGKGSTAGFLAQGLKALGYKTALYSSPHLIDYRERFTLSGTFFSEQQLLLAANTLYSLIEDFQFSDEYGQSEITTFELLTAYAFFLFAQTECQWAVIEVGLGGRLDATNVLQSEAAIITLIEKEHTSILGNTLKEIALEKAKIIKENRPVFISYQADESKAIFYQESQNKNSKLFDLSKEVKYLTNVTSLEGQNVFIEWQNGDKTSLRLKMLGTSQGENATLALMVLKHLNLYKPQVSEKALENTFLPGRMEIIATKPYLMIDGAHTVQSLKNLIASFVQLFGFSGNTLIYGALEDKDHQHMISLILPHFDKIIVSRPGTFKKSDIDSLYMFIKQEALKSGREIAVYLEKESDDALNLALSLTESSNAILCTGSFYMGGEIVRSYKKREKIKKYVSKLS